MDRHDAGGVAASAAMPAAEAAAFVRLPNPHRPNHAVYGALLRPGLLDQFDAYGNPHLARELQHIHHKPVEIVHFDCRIGPRLTGHDDIVHGGIVSLLVDEACGWAYEGVARAGWDDAAPDLPGVTVNLSVTYRRPLEAGVSCVMRVHLEKREGRKVFFRAALEGVAGGVVYADATCVFVALRSKL